MKIIVALISALLIGASFQQRKVKCVDLKSEPKLLGIVPWCCLDEKTFMPKIEKKCAKFVPNFYLLISLGNLQRTINRDHRRLTDPKGPSNHHNPQKRISRGPFFWGQFHRTFDIFANRRVQLPLWLQPLHLC